MSCTYDGRSRRSLGLRLGLGVAPLSNRLGDGMINRNEFFPRVREAVFRSWMTQPQVDGLNALIDACPDSWDGRWLAYALATAFHETAGTMQPIPEFGHGRGRPYGEPVNGHVYYGRGYVQLTWEHNYAAMSPVVGADLVADPDLALQPDIAAKVMFYGMEQGTFTGKKLADFIHQDVCDFLHARQIINGMDRASLVAGYAQQFLYAIERST